MAAKKQLGQILLEAGAIDEFQLKSALGYQKQWGGRLGKVLVENRFITETALAEAIHKQTGIEIVQLEKLKVPDYVIKMVPVELAEKNSMVPVRLEGEAGKPGECVVLAMSDPTNLNVLDEVQFRTGKRAKGLLATESSIAKAIRFYYHGEEGEGPEELISDPHNIQFGGQEMAADEMVVVQGKLESAPEKTPQPPVSPTPASPPEPAAAPVDAEDPFAELESLAKGPDPQPPPPPTPLAPAPETEPAEMIDVDIDVGIEEETSPATPSAIETSDAAGAAPTGTASAEDDLPEVEILEELPEAAPEPEPPSPPEASAEEEEIFGKSGELLGSDGLAEELFGDQPEPATEPEPPREEKKSVEADKKSSAMDALLSRVGIGGKPGAVPKEEPKEAPQPDLPDLDEPALLDDVERLLDRLESDEEDTELPQMMKSSHLIAALIRLLLKKDVLTQEELLEELKKR
jgi:hypothetical protein